MYVTWIDKRVVRSAALTLYSFCFDAQLVYQHPIKVIKLIKLLHSCLFLFATFDTLFYYLPFVSTICVCAISWVWVFQCVYRCFGLSALVWLHHRIGFSDLFLYSVFLTLSLFPSFFVLTNMGICWIMSTWWHHHEGSINYKRTYGFNSQAWLYNYGEQVHKIISTCSFVALNKIFLWAFPIHRIAFSAYSIVQHSINTKIFITYLACVRAQHRVHCRCVCPWYLFRLHICLSVSSIYANPAGEIYTILDNLNMRIYVRSTALQMICTVFSGGCRFQISYEF